jgi:preprotein translocase subunit YajC
VSYSLLDFFISPAGADTGMGPTAGSSTAANFSLPLMLVVFVAFLYFTVWRPQNKRAKEQRDMMNSLTKGDEIVTAGGIVGKVSKITQSYVVMAVSDTVEITVQKSAVATVLPKGTLKAI